MDETFIVSLWLAIEESVAYLQDVGLLSPIEGEGNWRGRSSMDPVIDWQQGHGIVGATKNNYDMMCKVL